MCFQTTFNNQEKPILIIHQNLHKVTKDQARTNKMC